ncbi:hypothetical protein [Roseibium sp.]|uniref:hypothetical protein n=1 Tax=Roseibium sp. TaxID=1936156 RepID=UPI003B51A57D
MTYWGLKFNKPCAILRYVIFSLFECTCSSNEAKAMPASGQSSRWEDRKSGSGNRQPAPKFSSPSKSDQGSALDDRKTPAGNAKQTNPHQARLIEDCLDKVLNSSEFKTTPQLRAFLQFIVDAALKGRKQDLKGHIIAVEALGRGPGFDPNSDPIVRVEAARLRSRLSDYYSGSGSDDPVQITVPKGGYAPVFLEVADPAATDDPVDITETEPDRSQQIQRQMTSDTSPAGSRPSVPQSQLKSSSGFQDRPTAGDFRQQEMPAAREGPILREDSTTSYLDELRKILTQPRYALLWVLIAGMVCFLAGYLAGRG